MPEYRLKLYITGHTATSVKAIAELKRISEEECRGLYDFTVVDILETPDSLEAERIVKTPELLKKLPAQVRKIIDELQDTQKLLVGLEISSTGKPSA